MGVYPYIFYIFTILLSNINLTKNIITYQIIQVEDSDVEGE